MFDNDFARKLSKESIKFMFPLFSIAELLCFDVIILEGATESGKDTLINILNDKKFKVEYKPTKNEKYLKPNILKLNNKKIGVINSSGAENKESIEKREKIRDDIFSIDIIEDIVRDKMIIFCYLFDASKMKDEKNNKIIKLILKALKKEIDEKPNNIIFKAIGTRGDKLNLQEIEKIENDIEKNLLLDCKIFDMTKSPKNDLVKFIIGKTK